MDEQDRAMKALLETFQREREQRDAAEAKARAAGTSATAARRRLPGGRFAPLLIAILVIVVLSVPLVVLAMTLADHFSAGGAIQRFCAAETASDYSGAYQLLSKRARQQVSSDGFAAASQASKLISCDLTRSAVWINTSGDKTDVDMAYIVEGSAENQTDVGTRWR